MFTITNVSKSYNKNAVTSIWVGYDDNKKLESNDYKYVKKIWANTMETYLKRRRYFADFENV